MINHEFKFIFVRVAKAASTSVLSRLPHSTKINEIYKDWKYDKNHVPLWYVKENLNNEIYEDYFKFAFVRNPFERAVSIVNYATDFWKNENIKFTLDCAYSLPEKSPFPVSKKFKEQFWSKYSNQFDFTNGCDFIGRLENFQEDFNIICDKIGIPHQELPHENATNHTHYTEYYDDETRQIVAEKYAKDIEYFGYKFGE